MLDAFKKKISEFISSEVKTDKERIHLQYVLILEILSVVSFLMVIINLITGWERMALITLIFAVLISIDLLIEKELRNFRRVGRISFIIELNLLYIAFLVTGEPEGSAAVWTLLMPCCGFLLFRMRHGMMITIIQLSISIILMWTPFGDALLLYDYTYSFKARFPVIYACFAIIGILFELIRLHSAEEMEKAKEEYKYMYNHDALTGLYNRYGFNASMSKYCIERKSGEIALAILDLDHFKIVNDRYGHLNGDEVLVEMARRIYKCVGDSGIVSRWGGEEFSILFTDTSKAEEKVNKLINTARAVPIELKDGNKVIVTFSMGVVVVRKNQEVEAVQLVRLADKFLYTAKEVGRNQIIMGEYDKNL